ncbi:MAG: ATP-dependent DNA helicase RecQ [Planctomycetota bacterium]
MLPEQAQEPDSATADLISNQNPSNWSEPSVSDLSVSEPRGADLWGDDAWEDSAPDTSAGTQWAAPSRDIASSSGSEAGLYGSQADWRAGNEASISSEPEIPESLEDRYELLLDRVSSVWGFEELRPLQTRAVRARLAGLDALVVMPTGGGKSLCYQAPALILPGLTVVVSPLISLMKDQIDGLVANGVSAAMMTSAQTSFELREVYQALEQRRLKLLYVAPERLMMDGFLERVEHANMTAIAVDEAHCISHWGHDFRPEYRQLGELRRKRPDLCVQAFTATATPRVRDDIAKQLGLNDPVTLVGNFDRPNLTYRVLPRTSVVTQTMTIIGRHQREAGIVYCLRRRDVEKIARELAGKGVRCMPYHAGLSSENRHRAQEAFLNERIDVVVATVAFGMGIDRPDVRFVVHASLPKGVEQYSQETGRAGRDGLPSECVLLYSGSDFHGWRSMMERSHEEARLAGQAVDDTELQDSLDRIGHIWNLACGAKCRHAALVAYFGQELVHEPKADGSVGGCGACDVCLGELDVVKDSQVISQKVLSCVVRSGQRYGGSHVADILRGAATARMRQTGHDQLSTYGLLSDHRTAEIRGWMDQLLALEHLASSGGDYPTLRLTPTGVEVMKGERDVSLLTPRRPEKATKRGRKATIEAVAAEGAPDVDENLFEYLRGLRRTMAKERGVPPYILFNDRTLALMAAHKPASLDEFLALKGIGERKAADLGEVFLAAIEEHGSRAPE